MQVHAQDLSKEHTTQWTIFKTLRHSAHEKQKCTIQLLNIIYKSKHIQFNGHEKIED